MSAPTTDPILLQIMLAFAAALAQISPANGFYNTVEAADVEPHYDRLNDGVIIHVKLETSDITDSKKHAYQDTALLAAHGFVAIDAASSRATAIKLLDDMLRISRSITSKTFQIGAPAPAGYVNANPSIVESWDFEQKREIVESEIADGFLEVIVRVLVTYRDFNPPLAGI